MRSSNKTYLETPNAFFRVQSVCILIRSKCMRKIHSSCIRVICHFYLKVSTATTRCYLVLQNCETWKCLENALIPRKHTDLWDLPVFFHIGMSQRSLKNKQTKKTPSYFWRFQVYLFKKNICIYIKVCCHMEMFLPTSASYFPFWTIDSIHKIM